MDRLEKEKRVYISGKISERPIDEAREEFKEVEDVIRHYGLEPINPFNNGLTADNSWLEHMHKDIDLVASCGAIYFLPNYEESNGAVIEERVANVYGITKIRDRQSLREYVEQVMSI